MTVAALLIAGCATTLETVYVPAENKGWKIGHGTNKPGTTLVEFIPNDQVISNWSRLFTIQFLEGARESPVSVMTTLQSQMRLRCPNSQWSVLSQDASSVTYEWSISGCGGQADQHEIARLLKGNEGVHRIAYTQKTVRLEPAEREKWLSAFSNAFVEKGGKRVAVAP